MSNSSEFQATPSTPLKTPAVTCASGCQHSNSGFVRAAFYTPVALLIGGLVALAAFPNLAEYAAPLIPESVGKPVYPFSGTGMSPGGYCCASQASRASCSSKQAVVVSSCGLSNFSCCSAPSESVIDAETPINAELTSESQSAEEGMAADALAAANSIITPESTAN